MSTGINPFFITHGYNTPLLDYNITAAAGTRNRGARTPAEIGNEITRKLREASDFAQAAIAYAQDIQQQYANQHRQPAERLRVGDRVWLNLKNVTTDRPCKKLDWKNGKYTVLEVISSHNYKLDTPPGIHDVFHISLLKRAADDPFPGRFPAAGRYSGWGGGMGGRTRLEGTRQGPLTPGFSKIERVFNPYIGTHGGPGRYRGVPRL